MMMDGTQREACSNQRDLFPAVEEVAMGWLTEDDDAGVPRTCAWDVPCISNSLRIIYGEKK